MEHRVRELKAMTVKDWLQIFAVIAAVSAGYGKLQSDITHIGDDVDRIERTLERLIINGGN